MNVKTFLLIITLFIIIDITGINNIWGENFHRRALHHIQRGQFNPNKNPEIHFLDKKLDQNIIDYSMNINFETKKKALQQFSPILSKLFGGGYSNKSFLYYSDFDNDTQKQLDIMGESMIPYLEKYSGKKLYLGTSDFRCVILKYEGADSEFIRHYDTEPASCYRTLFLIHKEGKPPPFFYYDKNGVKHNKHFDVGEGLFFKGTQTYHGVEPTEDPNMKRYMLGWQYTTEPKDEDISFCSKLRAKSVSETLKILLPHILFLLTLSLLIWYFMKSPINNKQISLLALVTLITTCIGVILPKILIKYNIGTGLTINLRSFCMFLLLSLVSCGNIFYGLIFFNYILLTEMLIPTDIIGKSLKMVDKNLN